MQIKFARAIISLGAAGVAGYFVHTANTKPALTATAATTAATIAYLSQKSRNNSQDIEEFQSLVSAKLDSGDYEGVVNYVNRINEENQLSAQAYEARGWSRYMLGEYENALQDLNNALEIDRSLTQAYVGRAFTFSKIGKFRESEKDWTEVLRRNANFYAARMERAVARREIGDFQASIRDCNKLLEVEKDAVKALNTRGLCHEGLGLVDEAIEDFMSAYDLSGDIGYLWNTGNIYMRNNDFDKAITIYDQIVETDSNFVGVYATRGRCKFLQGKEDEAREDFQAGAQLGDQTAKSVLEKLDQALRENIVEALRQRMAWANQFFQDAGCITVSDYHERLQAMTDGQLSKEAVGKEYSLKTTVVSLPDDMKKFMNRWGRSEQFSYGISDLRQAVINDYAYLCYQDRGTQPDETSLQEYKEKVEVMGIEELISETSVIETNDFKIDELADYIELWSKYSEYSTLLYDTTAEGGTMLSSKQIDSWLNT